MPCRFFDLRFDAVIFSGCPTLRRLSEGWAFRPSYPKWNAHTPSHRVQLLILNNPLRLVFSAPCKRRPVQTAPCKRQRKVNMAPQPVRSPSTTELRLDAAKTESELRRFLDSALASMQPGPPYKTTNP